MDNTQALRRIFDSRHKMLQTDQEVYVVNPELDAIQIVDDGYKMEIALVEDEVTPMVHLANDGDNFGWFALDEDGSLRSMTSAEFGRSSTEAGRELLVQKRAQVQTLVDKHLAELSGVAQTLPPSLSELAPEVDAANIHKAPLLDNDPEPGMVGSGEIKVNEDSLAEEAYENRIRLEVLILHDNNGILSIAERAELNALASILAEQLPGKDPKSFLAEVRQQVLQKDDELNRELGL